MYSKAFKIYQKCSYFKAYKIQTLKSRRLGMVSCRWWEKRGGRRSGALGEQWRGWSFQTWWRVSQRLFWLPQEESESCTQELSCYWTGCAAVLFCGLGWKWWSLHLLSGLLWHLWKECKMHIKPNQFFFFSLPELEGVLRNVYRKLPSTRQRQARGVWTQKANGWVGSLPQPAASPPSVTQGPRQQPQHSSLLSLTGPRIKPGQPFLCFRSLKDWARGICVATG